MPTVIVHLSNTTSVECEVSSIVTVSLLAAPVVFVMCCCVFAWCGRDTTEQIFCCFSSACFDCLQKVFGGLSRCGANLRARLTLFEFRSGSAGTTTTIELSPVCKFPDPMKFIPDGACSICLNEFAETELQAVQLACGHIFHLHCLSEWTTVSPSCPLCRAVLGKIT